MCVWIIKKKIMSSAASLRNSINKIRSQRIMYTMIEDQYILFANYWKKGISFGPLSLFVYVCTHNIIQILLTQRPSRSTTVVTTAKLPPFFTLTIIRELFPSDLRNPKFVIQILQIKLILVNFSYSCEIYHPSANIKIISKDIVQVVKTDPDR